MKQRTSEYQHEATRLRALIGEATTARARQRIEEQVRLNEQLATGRAKKPTKSRYGALGQAA
jgi:hypothetical protein